MNPLGKGILVFGLILVGIGLVLILVPQVPYLGRLPGDLRIEKGPVTFYFPLTTCLILSIILSWIFKLFR